jgi:hypothetical protein
MLVKQLKKSRFVSVARCSYRIHGYLTSITARSENGSVALVRLPKRIDYRRDNCFVSAELPFWCYAGTGLSGAG